jgi:hypothetical protein
MQLGPTNVGPNGGLAKQSTLLSRSTDAFLRPELGHRGIASPSSCMESIMPKDGLGGHPADHKKQ